MGEFPGRVGPSERQVRIRHGRMDDRAFHLTLGKQHVWWAVVGLVTSAGLIDILGGATRNAARRKSGQKRTSTGTNDIGRRSKNPSVRGADVFGGTTRLVDAFTVKATSRGLEGDGIAFILFNCAPRRVGAGGMVMDGFFSHGMSILCSESSVLSHAI